MITIAKKGQRINIILGRLARRNERIMQEALQKWFAFTTTKLRRGLSSLQKDAAGKITTRLTDWKVIEEEGKRIIKPITLEVMRQGGDKAYKILVMAGSFDVLNVEAVKLADKVTAKMVREVTDNTRAGIRTYIRDGIKEGKSMYKIGRELCPLVGLTENQVQSVANYRKLLEEKGLASDVIDRKVAKYGAKTHRRRAETIARTETARAVNAGYCQGLENLGVKQVELSAVASACEICAAMNGKKYGVREGAGIIPVHPNCRCAMLPVIGGKAITESKK